MEKNYQIRHEIPSAENFNQLRQKVGLSVKDSKAVDIGLSHTLFAVTIYDKDRLIAMGRVVGDGGTVFHVVDIAVNPSYQRKGLGKKVMAEIMDYLDTHTFKGSYVSLIADSPADKLYQQFGFCYTAPGSVGMYRMY